MVPPLRGATTAAASGSWRKFCERHGCRYHLWRRADILALPEFPYKEHYLATESPQGRADIARLEILRNVGGVYLDCDLMWAGDGDATDEFVRLLLRARGRSRIAAAGGGGGSGGSARRRCRRRAAAGPRFQPRPVAHLAQPVPHTVALGAVRVAR